MFDWYVFGAFIGYLALMLGIGLFFSKRQESLGDYYLGGRRMNKWVVALSAQASVEKSTPRSSGSGVFTRIRSKDESTSLRRASLTLPARVTGQKSVTGRRESAV